MGYPGKVKFPIYPLYIQSSVTTRESSQQYSVLSTTLNHFSNEKYCLMVWYWGHCCVCCPIAVDHTLEKRPPVFQSWLRPCLYSTYTLCYVKWGHCMTHRGHRATWSINYRPRSEGDNLLGSVRPSVCPSVTTLLAEQLIATTTITSLRWLSLCR